MGILIILGIIFYSVKIFKECHDNGTTTAQLLSRLHNPNARTRAVLRMATRHVMRDGCPLEMTDLRHNPDSACMKFARTVEAPGLDREPEDTILGACKNLTEAQLQAIIDEVG